MVILVAVAVIGLMVCSSAVAAARMRPQRWPTAYRVLHRSRHSVLRGQALRIVAPSKRARASIVGGGQIAITQAPWQAFVLAVIPLGKEEALLLLCGGSIIDETRVVTAGHCLFDPTTGSQVPAEHVFVLAGTSDFSQLEAGEQEVKAASVRVHPYYEYAAGAGAPDDVAVLTLAHSLTFNALVKPIELVASGATPAEGSPVNLTGFGRETPMGDPEGPLHSLGMTVGFSRPCGGETDAVFVCASASAGSGCEGDSGSGLTSGSTPELVGVMDTVEVISGEPCRPGSDDGFVNIAAPEIRDFIEGDEHPPLAPRGGGVSMRAVPQVGSTATCESGSWSGSPTFTYIFLNRANHQALQSGTSPTYQFTEADVGLSISCEVLAGNEGGTGMSRTTALLVLPGAPKVPNLPPGAIESGNEAAARALREAEAQRALEHQVPSEKAREAPAPHSKTAAHACVVPSLKGDSQSRARHALSRAHCKLGKVTITRGRHRGDLVVIRQRVNAGKKLPANAPVAVTMGRPPLHRK